MKVTTFAALPLVTALLAAQDAAAGERKLATIPDDLQLQTTYPGPDGKQYTDHTRFAFGADGRFVAYLAFRRGTSLAMANDTELGAFDFLDQPVMDDAALHYAFRAGERAGDDRERWWPIVDGKKGHAYDWIGAVAVSSAGVPAFWFERGTRIQKDGIYTDRPGEFCVGTRAGKKFDVNSLLAPLFSRNGEVAVTVAVQGDRWCVLTVGKRGEKLIAPGFTQLLDAAPSPDGKRIAIVALEGGAGAPLGAAPPPGTDAGKCFVVVDGKKYGEGADGVGLPVFAPDGKRFAYPFARGGKLGVVCDNEALPKAEYDSVGNIVFDANGTTLAFTSNQGGTFDPATRLQRSSEAEGGTWSLWTRAVGKAAKAVVEGAGGVRFPTFGPGGQLAYAQRDDGHWQIVVGAHHSAACDDVGPPQWSADGKTVAFGARVGRELWWKVLALQ